MLEFDDFINRCNDAIDHLTVLSKGRDLRDEDEKLEYKRLCGKIEGVKLARDYYIENKKLEKEMME